MSLRVCLTSLVLVAACGGAPQVEIVTRIGADAPAPKADNFIAQALLLRADRERDLLDPVLDDVLGPVPSDDANPRLPGQRSAQKDPASPSRPLATAVAGIVGKQDAPAAPLAPPEMVPARDQDGFAALVEAAEAAEGAELSALADALARTPALLWPEVAERLLADRKHRKADYKVVLDLIAGDVPNRYGHFERAWKRAHGHKVKLSEDWYTDLLALPVGRISKALRPVYRDCVITAALLRAGMQIGRDLDHSDAVIETLLAAGYVHDGTFRDEVGRAIRGIGDPALPALLRRSLTPPLPSDEKEANALRATVDYRKAEYAQVQLDRMDRSHPPRALAAASDDPRLLADLLSAYGIARTGEAAAPLLEHVNATIPRIRAAARSAFMAYVTGPAPKAERKTVRLLGGRTTEAPASLTYRDLARLAIRERLATEHPELLEPECRVITADGTRDATCAEQPARLAEIYFARLEALRREKEQKQIDTALAEPDRAAAVALLDSLLADNPDLALGNQLVPTYLAAAADAEAAGEHRRAAGLLRKSAALAGGSEGLELKLRALLLESQIDDLPVQGRAMLLATAESLAPDDPKVLAAVSQVAARPLGSEAVAMHRQLEQAWLVLCAGLLVLLGLGHLLRQRRVL